MFARFGRPEAEGAFATCHCLTLPESEPGYYFWKDRDDRRADAPLRVVRHQVAGRARRRHANQVSDLVRAAALLRSDARTIVQGRALSATLARGSPSSTPSSTSSITSIRPRPACASSCTPTARDSMRSHGPQFYEDVAEMMQAYLASNPDPALYEFLKRRFRGARRPLRRRVGDDVQEFPVVPAALHGAGRQLPVESQRA